MGISSCKGDLWDPDAGVDEERERLPFLHEVAYFLYRPFASSSRGTCRVSIYQVQRDYDYHPYLHVLLSLNPTLGLIKDFGDHRRQFCQPLPRLLESFPSVCLYIDSLYNTSNLAILVPRRNMNGSCKRGERLVLVACNWPIVLQSAVKRVHHGIRYTFNL